MSKHTKGPWVALRDDPGQFQVATVELIGIYSSHGEYGGADCGQPEADARLIAAAPDMLEALNNTLALALLKWGNLDEDANKVFGQARAAIARATGEPT